VNEAGSQDGLLNHSPPTRYTAWYELWISFLMSSSPAQWVCAPLVN
jgi:hypothetical protein